jgi:hypothetical protein
MAQPFLAMITPLSSGGHPDQGLPGAPPGIWPSPGHPAHPIAPGGPPLGFWGGVGQPYPDQGLPGAPPGIWPSPGHPAHPIAPGGRPPGIWGGPPMYPDQGLPGQPPGIWGGGNLPMPTPPIYLPPGSIPGLKPEHPIFIPPSIWPNPGRPTHPIVLPPPGSEEKPQILENWDAVTAWSPQSGWVVAIVPSQEHPGLPTPSKTKV